YVGVLRPGDADPEGVVDRSRADLVVADEAGEHRQPRAVGRALAARHGRRRAEVPDHPALRVPMWVPAVPEERPGGLDGLAGAAGAGDHGAVAGVGRPGLDQGLPRDRCARPAGDRMSDPADPESSLVLPDHRVWEAGSPLRAEIGDELIAAVRGD